MQKIIYRITLYIVSCCFILLLLLPERVFSVNFTVNPVRIFFDSRSRTNILTIKNESDESVTLQLRAYSWKQDEKGENIYLPTKDIIFFPKIVTIKKGEEKIIRVGTNLSRNEYEQTYRLYIEEVPAPSTVESTAVRIIMKVGVPIFISPLKAEAKGSIDKKEIREGKLNFTVKNDGNVHFIMKAINVKGSDASAHEVFKTEIGGGYLHGGSSKGFTIEIPKEACLKMNNLEINIDTDRLSLVEKINVLREMCTP